MSRKVKKAIEYFELIDFSDGALPEFPLDLVGPKQINNNVVLFYYK